MVQQYQIILSKSAEKDLTQLYNYIYQYDNPANANYVIAQIQKEIETLGYFPERGNAIKKFSGLDIHHFKQCYFKTYPIIYTIQDEYQRVAVLMIVDGHRNTQRLITKRLL